METVLLRRLRQVVRWPILRKSGAGLRLYHGNGLCFSYGAIHAEFSFQDDLDRANVLADKA
jgi:hypothetical protein